MKNYTVYTMCRSGNHAIIFWILENLGGCNEKIDGCCYWNNDNKVYFYNNCNHIKYFYLNNYEYMIRSYEDDFIDKLKNSNINNKNIVILRDFPNLITSRYKKYGEKLGLNWSYPQDIELIKKIWKNQAKSIINNESIGILYNKWVVDKEYRDKIGVILDIPNNKDKIDYVSNIGEGSSFCGVKLENDKTDYLNRYKTINLPEWIITSMISDDELVHLNKEIFGIDLMNIYLCECECDNSNDNVKNIENV